MAQDPYHLNTDDIRVEPSTADDEFDDLSIAPARSNAARNVAIAVLVVASLGAGGYFAYDALFPAAPAPMVARPPMGLNPTDPLPNDVIADEQAVGAPSAEELGIPPETITPPPQPEAGDENPLEEDEPAIMPQNDAAAVDTPADNATVQATALSPLPDMPAPVEPSTLQPVNPTAPLPQPPVTKSNTISDKTARTIAEVNEILGTATTPSPEVAPQPAASSRVEMTSRAQQVIHVKKTYPAQSSQAVLAAGDRVMQVHQYDQAVEIYDQQLKKNPSDPEALSGKALALQKAGKTKEAMNIYQRLVDKNPRDLGSLTNYLGLLQTQNPDEAMGRLSVLSERYPDNAAIAGQIGTVYATQMDTPNALRHFMKAQALDPENPTYSFNTAVLYDRLGNGTKAREYYGQALRIARQNPDMAGSLPIDKILDRLRALKD
jgi:Flp pilus assembly protein TadD